MWKQHDNGPPRIWVAGATGYTGKAVVARLRELGWETHAHIRPHSPSLESAAPFFRELGAEVQVVDWKPEALEARFKELKISHVFALLGTTAKKGRAEKSRGNVVNYETVDYGLTIQLLNAAKASGTCGRFIYLSAVGVSEKSRSPYMSARWKAEEDIRSSGVPYTIGRPCLITGSDREESRPMEDLGALLSKGVLGMAGLLGAKGLKARYQTVNGTTLGRGLVHAGFAEKGLNQVVYTEELVEMSSAPMDPTICG